MKLISTRRRSDKKLELYMKPRIYTQLGHRAWSKVLATIPDGCPSHRIRRDAQVHHGTRDRPNNTLKRQLEADML